MSLAVFDTGPADARPLLLAHGLTWDHRELDELALVLHDGGHRVVTYDARGVGQSTRRLTDTAAHSIDELAADCAAVIRALKGPSPVIGGASMGAAVTLEVAAARAAGPLAGIIQIAPGVGPAGVATDTAGYLRWIAGCVREGGWAGLRASIAASEQPPEDIQEQLVLAAEWEERFDPDTFVAQLTGFPRSVALPPRDQRPRAAPRADHLPGIVIAWPDDDFHPRSFADHVAQRLGGAAVAQIPRPTTPALPAASIAEAIEGFLRGLG